METCFNYCDKDMAYFSSTEQKWITRVVKWAVEFPEYVKIIKLPEENDGCIYCRMSPDFFLLRPKKSWTMTDEEKAAVVARFKRSQNDPQIG